MAASPSVTQPAVHSLYQQVSFPVFDGNYPTAARPNIPSSGWRANEPAGLSMVLDTAWDSLEPTGWAASSVPGINSIFSDASAPQSPNNILRHTYPAGFVGSSGGTTVYTTGNLGLTEFYTCMAVRWDPNWQAHSTGTNKLCYITGMTGGTAELFINLNTQQAQPRIILYNQASTDLGIVYPRVAEAYVTYGDWVQIELYLSMNTAYNLADGIVKIWVDGTLSTDISDAQFYDSAAQPGTVNGFKYEPVWGGEGGTVVSSMDLDVDHTYISGVAA